MKELNLNRNKFDAVVEKMIEAIKVRKLNCVNGDLNFTGLFDDQIYQLNTVDFIDGLEEGDSYLAVPMYTDGHLSGIFLTDNYSDDDDEDGNHEWLPSMEITISQHHLGRIQDEIKKRRDEIEK